SKLPRTVEVFARRPQIQEQMTIQIADAVEKELKAKGVMVLIEAEHMCLTMRGVKKPGTKTVTMATRGLFVEDQFRQKMFLDDVRSQPSIEK
ncbi:MAG: GTP cyclohydrolase I, partial [Oscillospiraceae bacterium]|nr:GTP cyclohydrolase I [Oscillospiraceae bacterium]